MSRDFPPAKEGDSENLAWLRSTAEALWGKGEREDGLMWLERAAKDAESEGRAERAAELREASTRLATGPKVVKPGMTTLVSDRQAVLNQAGVDVKVTDKPRSTGEETELSSRDVVTEEPADTRKFDYPEGVDPRAVTSAMVPEPAKLPDDVLPAIRVWITKGPAGGKVIPADGARPSGVVDAMLVSVVPGIDLRAALKGR